MTPQDNYNVMLRGKVKELDKLCIAVSPYVSDTCSWPAQSFKQWSQRVDKKKREIIHTAFLTMTQPAYTYASMIHLLLS